MHCVRSEQLLCCQRIVRVYVLSGWVNRRVVQRDWQIDADDGEGIKRRENATVLPRVVFHVGCCQTGWKTFPKWQEEKPR